MWINIWHNFIVLLDSAQFVPVKWNKDCTRVRLCATIIDSQQGLLSNSTELIHRFPSFLTTYTNMHVNNKEEEGRHLIASLYQYLWQYYDCVVSHDYIGGLLNRLKCWSFSHCSHVLGFSMYNFKAATWVQTVAKVHRSAHASSASTRLCTVTPFSSGSVNSSAS